VNLDPSFLFLTFSLQMTTHQLKASFGYERIKLSTDRLASCHPMSQNRYMNDSNGDTCLVVAAVPSAFVLSMNKLLDQMI